MPALNETDPSMPRILRYVFDPLCGWCYGASTTVAALAKAPHIDLHLLPGGLFAGAGARPMDDEFAAHAWRNDQRIEQLTGQRFSERYRQDVLADRRQAFDSGPASLALTAVALTAPDREWQALKAIQQARYVEGQDVTRPDTLAHVLRALGLDTAAARLAPADDALRAACDERAARAQALMRESGAHGVPAFLLEQDGRHRLLPADAVYPDPQAFVDWLATA